MNKTTDTTTPDLADRAAGQVPTSRGVVLSQPPSSEFEIEEVRDRLRRHRRRGDAPLGP